MPQFTEKFTIAYERMIGDQNGLTGHTTMYDIYLAKITAADRFNDQVLTLSANQSAVSVGIAPLGVTTPAQLALLVADQPVDLRTNSPSDPTCISGVRLFCLAGVLSAVYVTVGSNDTTVLIRAAGGSNAVLQATFPLP
jgi:hypothetical protein